MYLCVCVCVEVDEDEDYDNEWRSGAAYRSANNRTRLGVRAKTVHEKNNEIFENITHSVFGQSLRHADADADADAEVYEGFEDELEEEEEEEEDGELFGEEGSAYVLNGTFFKRARPVHKRFASTGLLCGRFGRLLAPIEEAQDEPPLQLEPRCSGRVRTAASCYDLGGGHDATGTERVGAAA